MLKSIQHQSLPKILFAGLLWLASGAAHAAPALFSPLPASTVAAGDALPSVVRDGQAVRVRSIKIDLDALMDAGGASQTFSLN